MAGSSGSRQGGGGKSAKRSKREPSNLSELKKAINPAKGAWKGKGTSSNPSIGKG